MGHPSRVFPPKHIMQNILFKKFNKHINNKHINKIYFLIMH